MSGTTPILALPYPDPTDPLSRGADDIRDLAEAVDGALGGYILRGGPAPQIIASSGSQAVILWGGWASPPNVVVSLQMQFAWSLRIAAISATQLNLFCTAGDSELPPGTAIQMQLIAIGQPAPGQTPGFAPTALAAPGLLRAEAAPELAPFDPDMFAPPSDELIAKIRAAGLLPPE